MKLYLYILAKYAAQYAASTTDAERRNLIAASPYPYTTSEWLQVGEVDWEPQPLTDATRRSAAEAITNLQRDVRAKAEAECTSLEAVKQSLLAIAYEGEKL